MGWSSKKKSAGVSGAEGAPASLGRVSQLLESLGYQTKTLDGQRFSFTHGEVPMLVFEDQDHVSIGSMVQADFGGMQNAEVVRDWVMNFNHHNLAPTMFVQDAMFDGSEHTVVVGEYRILRRIDFTAEQLENMVTFGIDAVAMGLQDFLAQKDRQVD